VSNLLPRLDSETKNMKITCRMKEMKKFDVLEVKMVVYCKKKKPINETYIIS